MTIFNDLEKFHCHLMENKLAVEERIFHKNAKFAKISKKKKKIIAQKLFLKCSALMFCRVPSIEYNSSPTKSTT